MRITSMSSIPSNLWTDLHGGEFSPTYQAVFRALIKGSVSTATARSWLGTNMNNSGSFGCPCWANWIYKLWNSDTSRALLYPPWSSVFFASCSVRSVASSLRQWYLSNLSGWPTVTLLSIVHDLYSVLLNVDDIDEKTKHVEIGSIC